MILGTHIATDINAQDLNTLKEAGMLVYQLMVDNTSACFYKPPKSAQLLKSEQLIFHMPFWTSFYNESTWPRSRRLIWSLYSFWHKLGHKKLQLVTHCQSTKLETGPRLSKTLVYLRYMYPVLKDRIQLCLENDPGNFSTNSNSVSDLLKVKNKVMVPEVGLTIDTEHAYANGETPDTLPYDKADIIHLNAIPPYVKFGAHLDRHSYTPLSASKEGSGFISKVKEKAGHSTPVIFERYPISTMVKDAEFITNL